MRRVLGFMLAALFLGWMTGGAFAQTVQSFSVSATVPLATGALITANRVDQAGNFTPVTGTSLSFDTGGKLAIFDAANGNYLPDHYFAVDVAPNGGAGSINVVVTYAEGNNPNSTTTNRGLGWKSTATFVKVVGTSETGLTAHGPKKLLKDILGENISATEISGGFLRVYLGIVSKDPAAVYPDPAEGETFTNGDRPGTYDGTITFTATVV